jgi:hypothetical protein
VVYSAFHLYIGGNSGIFTGSIHFVLQHPICNPPSYLKANTAHSGKNLEAVYAMAYTVAAFFYSFT